MSLLSLRTAPPEVPEAPPPAGWPLLRLGFRPFYLGAALFAVLAMPLWIALYLGQVTSTLAVPPLLWHAHEMLFGFAIAVIVGFLLTAGKAWTGLATPRGAFLGALALPCGLRRASPRSVGPYPLYAVLDLVLLPVVAAVMVDRAGPRPQPPQSAAGRHPAAAVVGQRRLPPGGARDHRRSPPACAARRHSP
jgi:uncharacterized protein involved in response to NO